MPVLCVENEWGTLIIMRAIGNPYFLCVFIDIIGDDTDYPPFYIPARFLSEYAGGIRAPR